jgi:hypothetical protein
MTGGDSPPFLFHAFSEYFPLDHCRPAIPVIAVGMCSQALLGCFGGTFGALLDTFLLYQK